MRRGWLGLDIGTTSSKAVVYDDAGQQLGAGRAPTVWTTAGPHVEIDPEVLLAGALAAANEAVAATDADVEIAGIGLTSMAETGVLVDRAGRPVAAAIAWHDQRDRAEVAALGDQIGRATYERRTGKPLRPQSTLTKHRWLLDHEPAAHTGVRWFNVAEWVARGLGADECCELSLAGRTGWYDLFRGTWDEDLLAWSGATVSLMPPLVEAGAAIGIVRSSDAHPRLRGAVVTIAGHDHQSAAVGCGAENAGDELDSSGTAEALVRTVEATLTADEVERLTVAGITVDPSVQAGRWSVLGGTQGGLAMARTLRLIGVDPRRPSVDPRARSDDPRGRSDDLRGRGDDPRGRGADPRGSAADPRGRGDDFSGRNTDMGGRGDDVRGRRTDMGGWNDDLRGRNDYSGARNVGPGGRSADSRGQGDGPGVRGADLTGLAALDAAALAAGASPAEGLAVTIADGTVQFVLSGDVSPGVVWRSVVNAVTREAAALHEIISAVTGPHTRIVAAGGWCASAMVLDAKRRLLGDFTLSEVDEPGAFGAAILAARAAGHLEPTERLGGAVGAVSDGAAP